jgi:uncharacterized protein YjlB
MDGPAAALGDAASAAAAVFASEGLVPHTWSNESGYRYAAHRHPLHKVLICVEGSITFHTADGEFALRSGDRLDLPAGTAHRATVGQGGVTCMEAYRAGRTPDRHSLAP